MSEVATVEINYFEQAAPALDTPTAPAPALKPTAVEITVSEQSLEKLISDAQEKLTAMKAASYVTDNRIVAQREIDAAQNALHIAETTIHKFEGLIADALVRLDAAIEHQFGSPQIGTFGVPLAAQEANAVNSAASSFVQLKQSLCQQRRSRAIQASRLDGLLRVQAQYEPTDATR